MICQAYCISIEAPKEENGVEKRTIRIAGMTTMMTLMTTAFVGIGTVEEVGCDKIRPQFGPWIL